MTNSISSIAIGMTILMATASASPGSDSRVQRERTKVREKENTLHIICY